MVSDCGTPCLLTNNTLTFYGKSIGIAFAFDPDGYWVEIVKRVEAGKNLNYFSFSQTMLR